MSWAQRRKPVFAIDLAHCRRCGGRLQVIASSEDPALSQRILTHLQQPAEHEPPRAATREQGVSRRTTRQSPPGRLPGTLTPALATAVPSRPLTAPRLRAYREAFCTYYPPTRSQPILRRSHHRHSVPGPTRRARGSDRRPKTALCPPMPLRVRATCRRCYRIFSPLFSHPTSVQRVDSIYRHWAKMPRPKLFRFNDISIYAEIQVDGW